MTRTRPATLVLLAVAGGAVGWLLEMVLVAMGSRAVVPPLTLAVTLVALAAVALALAWPVRQSVRGTVRRRVDPFQATRVVVLAKASSLCGALLAGLGGGVLAFLATRPVVASAESLWLAAASAMGSLVLLAAGLVAELWCTIPPDDPKNGGGSAQLDGSGQATTHQ
jgi:hypothetical protein